MNGENSTPAKGTVSVWTTSGVAEAGNLYFPEMNTDALYTIDSN